VYRITVIKAVAMESIPQVEDDFSDLLDPHPKQSPVLQAAEVMFNNIGSACFLIGATCFFRQFSSYCMGYSCDALGSVLAVIGTLSWSVGSYSSFRMNIMYSVNTRILMLYSVAKILANILISLGLAFLMPIIAHYTTGYHLGGIMMCIAGFTLLTVAFSYDIYRACQMVNAGHISLREFFFVVFIGLCFIIGSICCITGSVYRIPTAGHWEDFVGLTLAGSLLFLLATLAAPFAVSLWTHKIDHVNNDAIQMYSAVEDSTHSTSGRLSGESSTGDEDYVFVG
jgi:hypothetical protein